MQMELEERALVEGPVSKPSAGYLFFPQTDRKPASYQLEYDTPGGTPVRLNLAAPKTK
jgi:hypothetical protein